MTCRLEKQMTDLLESNGIAFTRPDRDQNDPAGLDYYLTDFHLYIEVKQFHTPRIAAQLSKVPEKITAIVLVGPQSVTDFVHLCRRLRLAPALGPLSFPHRDKREST